MAVLLQVVERQLYSAWGCFLDELCSRVGKQLQLQLQLLLSC